jgi:hypothetical protein
MFVFHHATKVVTGEAVLLKLYSGSGAGASCIFLHMIPACGSRVEEASESSDGDCGVECFGVCADDGWRRPLIAMKRCDEWGTGIILCVK